MDLFFYELHQLVWDRDVKADIFFLADNLERNGMFWLEEPEPIFIFERVQTGKKLLGRVDLNLVVPGERHFERDKRETVFFTIAVAHPKDKRIAQSRETR